MTKNPGFSLVELSIVLVILGLLVGGVLSGQSLIRAAELRSVTQEYQSNIAAINSFKDKYFALPGDMTNATAFWGTQASPTSTASTDTKTCNGNGNGQIESANATCDEAFRAWQQMANGGLIQGKFDGVGMGAGFYPNVTTTTNSPHGRISTSAWYIESLPWTVGSLTLTLEYGSVNPYHDYSVGSLLSPQDAWNIDTKMDDGMPNTGKVLGQDSVVLAAGASLHCSNQTVAGQPTATYILTNGATCSFAFLQ